MGVPRFSKEYWDMMSEMQSTPQVLDWYILDLRALEGTAEKWPKEEEDKS